jgi:hypothetical protein
MSHTTDIDVLFVLMANILGVMSQHRRAELAAPRRRSDQ